MRAVVLEKYGGPEVLQIRDVPELTPGKGEVRVAVSATALNRADVLQRMGKYPPPGPKPEFEIPGLEFSGRIDIVGTGSAWKEGDSVFGLLPGGGYAEQVVTHERMLLRMPNSMNLSEAASIPEVYLTAWDALEAKGSFQSGETVLIHAGGSGVGVAATQLAKLMGASRIFTTTRSPEKSDSSKEQGADRVIIPPGESFEEIVLSQTNGRGADLILDFVGGPYLEGNLKAAALKGRIVQIAAQAGSRVELSLGTMMTKRLRLTGTSLRSRPLEQKMLLTREFERRFLPHFESKALHSVIDKTYPFEEVGDAHRRMESNANFGKILLEITT